MNRTKLYAALTFLCVAALGAASCSTVRELPAEKAIAPGSAAELIKTDDYWATTVSIDIQSPPDQAWGVLADVKKWPEWNSTVNKIEGDLIEGKIVKLVSTVDPEREFELNVAKIDAPRELVFDDGMPLGLFSGVRTYSLTPTADGMTRFTMTEMWSGGMMGMIVEEIPDMRPSFDAWASDFKKTVEAAAAS